MVLVSIRLEVITECMKYEVAYLKGKIEKINKKYKIMQH